MRNSGFTLLELVMAVGVTSMLATSGFYAYSKIVPKVQSAEATKLINAEKAKMIEGLKQGKCGLSNSGAIGRNGGLNVSGTYLRGPNPECPTGCRLTYTFNNTVSSHLRGKVLAVDLLHNFDLNVNTQASTLEDKFISSTFKDNISNACPSSGNIAPNLINPGSNLDGVEVGLGNGSTPSNPGNGDLGDDIEDEIELPPVAPPDPPPPPRTPDEDTKENIVKNIEDELSHHFRNDPIFVEPQGFAYTVTAKPPRPNGQRCSDTFDVKPNEWVVRAMMTRGSPDGNGALHSNLYYDGEDYLNIVNQIEKTLKTFKDGQITAPINFYIPCYGLAFSWYPRFASMTTGKYSLSAGAYIKINNFGVITGRGGNGPLLIKTPRKIYRIDGPDYSYDDNTIRPFTGESQVRLATYKDIFIDLPNVPSHGKVGHSVVKRFWNLLDIGYTKEGGIAFINENPNHEIEILNRGIVMAGGNAHHPGMQKNSECLWYGIFPVCQTKIGFPALKPTDNHVDPFPTMSMAGGARPWGYASDIMASPERYDNVAVEEEYYFMGMGTERVNGVEVPKPFVWKPLDASSATSFAYAQDGELFGTGLSMTATKNVNPYSLGEWKRIIVNGIVGRTSTVTHVDSLPSLRSKEVITNFTTIGPVKVTNVGNWSRLQYVHKPGTIADLMNKYKWTDLEALDCLQGPKFLGKTIPGVTSWRVAHYKVGDQEKPCFMHLYNKEGSINEFPELTEQTKYLLWDTNEPPK